MVQSLHQSDAYIKRKLGLWRAHTLGILLGGHIILREKELVIFLETLKPATPHWKTVGLALGFLDYELTAIECTPLLIPEGLTERDAEPCQWLK